MTSIRQDERGIALAVAIFALVIVGALVAGAFFAGTQEQRVGENSRRMQQSFGVAEVGVAQQVATWDPQTRNITPVYPGGSVSLTDAPSVSGVYGGRILKLNDNLYLIDIMAQDSASRSGRLARGGARQRIGLLTRVMPLQIDIEASLTTQGGANLSGNAVVDGADHTPPGWTDCDAPDTAQAGIRVNGPVTTSGNATVTGDPEVMQDPTLNDSTFTQYGDVNYAQLTARATLVVQPANMTTQPTLLADGTCNKGDFRNWGDGINQNAPCSNYFPIIYIPGSAGKTTLNGIQGQGILLVDGDLEVQGSYEFFGIVIIRGSLKTAGGGTSDAHFWGGVMAQNVDLDLQNLSGKATLNYSKCAILQALQMSQPVAPMVSRGWAQLF
ncbi:MAG: pilus assembly PilX N-terminal domain-containing protein [Gemmatimonadales bacterium]|nr:pilus assembly PilX N-terminal domain-containing protein [Gemmatimonadales bacterium]